MVQLRRADGRDWDGLMHVNPQLPQKGFVLLYNPLKTKINRTISLPLYYTGLSTSATITDSNGNAKKYTLSRDYSVPFTFTLLPESYSWFVIE